MLLAGGCLFFIQCTSTRKMPASIDITVLTYNIHHANPPSREGLIDVDGIARVIREQQPDLVALQEVDVHTTRSGVSLNQAQAIAERTGMTAYFAKAIPYAGGEYGVAILSRYPVLEWKNIPLPLDSSTRGEPRTLAMATVKLPNGKKMVVACTHLDAQRADTNRQLQIRKILELAGQLSLPMVIAGDLNAVPESDVMKQFDSHFTRSCYQNCGYTIPEVNPTRSIDYIGFAPSEAFRVKSHQVIDESYASDHRPVKAVLTVQ